MQFSAVAQPGGTGGTCPPPPIACRDIDVRDIVRVFFSVRHRSGPPTQSERMLKGKTLLMKELSQKSRMSMSTLTSVHIEENDGSKTSDSFDIEMALDAPERCRRRALAEPRA